MSWAEPSGNYDLNPDNARHVIPYAEIGADPFNVAIARLLTAHGSRDAQALPCGGGVAILADTLVVPTPRASSVSPAALVPGPKGAVRTEGVRVVLPKAYERARLVDALSGQPLAPMADGSYHFFARAICRIES